MFKTMMTAGVMALVLACGGSKGPQPRVPEFSLDKGQPQCPNATTVNDQTINSIPYIDCFWDCVQFAGQDGVRLDITWIMVPNTGDYVFDQALVVPGRCDDTAPETK
jgi:hypothetical protein